MFACSMVNEHVTRRPELDFNSFRVSECALQKSISALPGLHECTQFVPI